MHFCKNDDFNKCGNVFELFLISCYRRPSKDSHLERLQFRLVSMRPIFQNTWNSSSVNSCLQDGSVSATASAYHHPAISNKQDYNNNPRLRNHQQPQQQQLPSNTTTWQKQQHRKQMFEYSNNSRDEERLRKIEHAEMGSAPADAEMLDIHLKLEEKRKQIENEKRRQEEKLNRQREKLGKAAFLQAVSKDVDFIFNRNLPYQQQHQQQQQQQQQPPQQLPSNYYTCSNSQQSQPELLINKPTMNIYPRATFSSYEVKSPLVTMTYTSTGSGDLRAAGFSNASERYLTDSLSKQLHIAPNSIAMDAVDRASASGGFYIGEDISLKQRPQTKPVMSEMQTIQRLNNLFNEAEMEKEDVEKIPGPRCGVTFKSTANYCQFTKGTPTGVGLIIEAGEQSSSQLADEMERRKERILTLSLQRRQQQEEMKVRKEIELQKRREKEKEREENKAKKREEEKRRRNIILTQYRLKKAIEDAEREGIPIDKESLNSLKSDGSSSKLPPQMRRRTTKQIARQRPKTIHISSSRTGSNINTPDNMSDGSLTPSCGRKGSSSSLSGNNYLLRRNYYRSGGSQDCLLAQTARTSASSICSDVVDDSCVSSPSRSICTGRTAKHDNNGTLKFENTAATSQKSNSLMNLSASNGDQDSSPHQNDPDSGLGRDTPSQGVLSPNHDNGSNNGNRISGPGSLPTSKKRYDDAASESGSEYSVGLRLYKQPTVKSNRSIILNAVEYCVFPGAVNREGKRKVVEEINKSADTKHFLILFRDSGCQFRALYSYVPETEQISKLYGTGPKQVTDRMFDKFFKYNSGAKCFSQIHTKHLTVTIDAFTIHNSLWQGKKVNLPNKKDLPIII